MKVMIEIMIVVMKVMRMAILMMIMHHHHHTQGNGDGDDDDDDDDDADDGCTSLFTSLECSISEDQRNSSFSSLAIRGRCISHRSVGINQGI